MAAPTLCPPERLARIAAAVRTDAARSLGEIDAALADHPADARLRFLRGSVLAGLERYDEARAAMAEAVALAPAFHIARFQLGLLQLTSGAAGDAEATWAPLAGLPPGHYLRVFAEGLGCLIRDEFDGCAERLTRGMTLNAENLALNGDMQLILDRLAAEGRLSQPPAPAEPVSAAHLLLRRYADRGKPN
jgi:tetratricopeptide (TPR) repeat protein